MFRACSVLPSKATPLLYPTQAAVAGRREWVVTVAALNTVRQSIRRASTMLPGTLVKANTKTVVESAATAVIHGHKNVVSASASIDLQRELIAARTLLTTAETDFRSMISKKNSTGNATGKINREHVVLKRELENARSALKIAEVSFHQLLAVVTATDRRAAQQLITSLVDRRVQRLTAQHTLHTAVLVDGRVAAQVPLHTAVLVDGHAAQEALHTSTKSAAVLVDRRVHSVETQEALRTSTESAAVLVDHHVHCNTAEEALRTAVLVDGRVHCIAAEEALRTSTESAAVLVDHRVHCIAAQEALRTSTESAAVLVDHHVHCNTNEEALHTAVLVDCIVAEERTSTESAAVLVDHHVHCNTAKEALRTAVLVDGRVQRIAAEEALRTSTESAAVLVDQRVQSIAAQETQRELVEKTVALVEVATEEALRTAAIDSLLQSVFGNETQHNHEVVKGEHEAQPLKDLEPPTASDGIKLRESATKSPPSAQELTMSSKALLLEHERLIKSIFDGFDYDTCARILSTRPQVVRHARFPPHFQAVYDRMTSSAATDGEMNSKHAYV